MSAVCSRCGAHIKHTFRVGDFLFGSECISKVDAPLMHRLYGERLDLGAAVQAWASRILRSKAAGVRRDISLDISRVPAVGARVKPHATYPGSVEVVGYTAAGIRVKGVCAGRVYFNDLPFDRDLLPAD